MVPGRAAEKFPPQEPIVREIDEPKRGKRCSVTSYHFQIFSHYTVLYVLYTASIVCVTSVYCK